MHEEKGVHFMMDAEVAELVGDEEGNLTEVSVTSGRILRADILVAGLGVLPCTDFLRASDVILDSRGFVPVDKVGLLLNSFNLKKYLPQAETNNFFFQHMRTNCQDVYAVGDIALFPIHSDQEQESSLVNIGHWQMALHHGRTAGKKLLNIFPRQFQNSLQIFSNSSQYTRTFKTYF